MSRSTQPSNQPTAQITYQIGMQKVSNGQTNDKLCIDQRMQYQYDVKWKCKQWRLDCRYHHNFLDIGIPTMHLELFAHYQLHVFTV